MLTGAGGASGVGEVEGASGMDVLTSSRTGVSGSAAFFGATVLAAAFFTGAFFGADSSTSSVAPLDAAFFGAAAFLTGLSSSG